MKKAAIIILTFGLFGILGSIIEAAVSITAATNERDARYITVMKQDILALMLAYPEFVVDVEMDERDSTYIVMKSGKKIIYDDKKKKSVEQKLANPDLQDMLEQQYPLSPINQLMDKNFDPGRRRVYELLLEVYGGTRQSIQKNLTNVNVGYGNYQFNRSNGASEALKAAMLEVKEAVRRNGKIGSYVFPASGTFNYRVIAGTGRLSPHSFAIAIDLTRDKRDYWQWASREEGEKRLKSYPNEVVEAFERNNFVWGGKWGHFDILHFEYRPEIIIKAKYFSSKDKEDTLWYSGAPVEEEKVKACIDKIESVIR